MGQPPLTPIGEAALQALEPFAKVAEITRPDLSDDTVIALTLNGLNIYHMALGSFRAARSAIELAERL